MKRTLVLGIACAIIGCNNNGSPSSASSLTGTWELAGAPGTSGIGTLVLSPTGLTVTISGNVFDLQLGTPTFNWTDSNGSPSITATHSSGPLDSGIIPLALGGDWAFTGATAFGGACRASLQPGSMTGNCAGVGESPLFDLNRTATATRTAQLSSVFGDLGGTWTLTDDTGDSCTFTLQGSTIVASCGSAGLSMTFSDGMVSGSLDSGAEFSARRQ